MKKYSNALVLQKKILYSSVREFFSQKRKIKRKEVTHYGSQEKGEEDHYQEEVNIEKEKEVVLLVLIRIDNAPFVRGVFVRAEIMPISFPHISISATRVFPERSRKKFTLAPGKRLVA